MLKPYLNKFDNYSAPLRDGSYIIDQATIKSIIGFDVTVQAG